MVPRMLDDKIAIVTGAAHGIGRGHALELARHGATVIVADLGTSVRGEGRGSAHQRTGFSRRIGPSGADLCHGPAASLSHACRCPPQRAGRWCFGSHAGG